MIIDTELHRIIVPNQHKVYDRYKIRTTHNSIYGAQLNIQERSKFPFGKIIYNSQWEVIIYESLFILNISSAPLIFFYLSFPTT